MPRDWECRVRQVRLWVFWLLGSSRQFGSNDWARESAFLGVGRTTEARKRPCRIRVFRRVGKTTMSGRKLFLAGCLGVAALGLFWLVWHLTTTHAIIVSLP